MTFLSLSKAQQRELLRAYHADELQRGSIHMVALHSPQPLAKLVDLAFMQLSQGTRGGCRITPAGRELVERWQRDSAARRERAK